ncbi:MAG: OprD family outer membrane porin [Cyclobacteriaceae bacterium]|nr:OprD family outer membrane porin [Cyclobacteriaceae bacterium]
MNMKYSIQLLLCALFFFMWNEGVAFSSHPKKGENPNDTISSYKKFGDYLQSGTYGFHLRSFGMSTYNKGDLLNYSASAVGGGLSYESPEWKGVSLGISGFFVFQVHAQNIDQFDPTTGNVNRYEALLFDMNDLTNTKDLDRMEELYIKYHYKNFRITAGRQHFNSPLMNEQDNRMRPNIYSGFHGTYELGSRWTTHAAWFFDIAPRGTVDWYSIGESMGVYPFGRNTFGEASEYKGNMSTAGIGVYGLEHKNDTLRFQLWNYFAENIFNLTFSQLDLNYPIDFQHKLLAGVQGFYQSVINNGGNENPDKAYINRGENTHGVGLKLGIQRKSQRLSLNYLNISDNGRFLFPREWGREQFYTSLARERYEGKGGVQAITAKYERSHLDKRVQSMLGLSTVMAPEANNFFLNKYGVPSYYHFLFSIDYFPKNFWEGLDLKLLVVHKLSHNPDLVQDSNRINRVDLWNLNLIMDYRF